MMSPSGSPGSLESRTCGWLVFPKAWSRTR